MISDSSFLGQYSGKGNRPVGIQLGTHRQLPKMAARKGFVSRKKCRKASKWLYDDVSVYASTANSKVRIMLFMINLPNAERPVSRCH